MQILIALCSNILKTMTVVIFGGPWWFDHILWKLESMMLVHRLVERCESVYKSAFLGLAGARLAYRPSTSLFTSYNSRLTLTLHLVTYPDPNNLLKEKP